MFGSSNVGGTQAIDATSFPNQISSFPSNALRLTHATTAPANGTSEAYSDPVNDSPNSSVYSLLKEDMAYGPCASLIKNLADNTSKDVIVASVCKSAIPYNRGNGTKWDSRNASDPDDLTTYYGQVLARCNELEAFTGEDIDFIYMPDAGGDGALGNLARTSVDSVINVINNLRADLGYTVPIIIPSLGPTPDQYPVSYRTWEAVYTEMKNRVESLPYVKIIDRTDDANNNLTDHVQWELPWSSASNPPTFQLGETITGSLSGASRKVSGFNYSASRVYIEDNNGTEFVDNDVVTGGTSGATATLDLSAGAVTPHYNTEGYNNLGTAAYNVLQEILITQEDVSVDPDGSNNSSTTSAIDVHSSATATSGTASASTFFNSNFEPWEAVDSLDSNFTASRWISSTSSNPQYWQYQFSSAKQINKYELGVFDTDRGPRDWTVQASNTGAFSGEEITLDTVTGNSSWARGTNQMFTFVNSNSYTYYRINVTETANTSDFTEIADLKLIEAS